MHVIVTCLLPMLKIDLTWKPWLISFHWFRNMEANLTHEELDELSALAEVRG
jgi:hypothetical protein